MLSLRWVNSLESTTALLPILLTTPRSKAFGKAQIKPPQRGLHTDLRYDALNSNAHHHYHLQQNHQKYYPITGSISAQHKASEITA